MLGPEVNAPVVAGVVGPGAPAVVPADEEAPGMPEEDPAVLRPLNKLPPTTGVLPLLDAPPKGEPSAGFSPPEFAFPDRLLPPLGAPAGVPEFGVATN